MHQLFNGMWYCLAFCCDHSLGLLSLQLSWTIGQLNMGARGRNPKRPNGDLLRSRDPCARWRGQSMWTYSWKPRNNGPKTAPTASSYSMRCSCMPHPKDRRRQSKLSAKAAGSTCPNWTLRQDVPAIQLVHLETDREKLLDLYLEVYKLHRLPSSPPGEPAILEEVLSALPCHSLEEKGTPDVRQPSPEDFYPPQSRLSRQERESSLDRSLARVCKVHRKVLLTAATLEEEIKRLHRMKAHSGPEWRPRDSQRPEERRRKRWCQDSFSSQPTVSQSTNPDTHSGRTVSKGGDLDLGESPQLKVEVASFLQGSSKMQEEEDEEMLPEPPVSQSTEWVWWKAEKCDVPDWWAELSTVLLEDTGRLAWEVRASFWLPRHMHELDPREAPFHATLAPPCLHQQRFIPPLCLTLLAGTSEKFPGRRQLHTPELCSASQNRITHQGGTGHAFWWRAWPN